MELPDAQKEFMEILHRVKDPSTLSGFLGWIQENWFADSNKLIDSNTRLFICYSFVYSISFCSLIQRLGGEDTAVVVNGVEAEEFLENIAADIRQLLPIEAQLPSETIIFPKTGAVYTVILNV